MRYLRYYYVLTISGAVLGLQRFQGLGESLKTILPGDLLAVSWVILVSKKTFKQIPLAHICYKLNMLRVATLPYMHQHVSASTVPTLLLIRKKRGHMCQYMKFSFFYIYLWIKLCCISFVRWTFYGSVDYCCTCHHWLLLNVSKWVVQLIMPANQPNMPRAAHVVCRHIARQP